MIGFAGRTGAGKTSAAKYLSSQYGFQYVRYSQVLQEWLSSGSADRDQLRTLGWEVMAGGQQVELNRRLIEALDPSRSAAIDGLRHQIDFECLSEAFSRRFQLIFLEARPEIRLERLRSRFSTIKAFEAAETAPVEAHIDSLRLRASTTIANEGSAERLYRELDSWLGVCQIMDSA